MSMGFLWDFFVVPMIVPWDFYHGVPMAFLPAVYRISMGFL